MKARIFPLSVMLALTALAVFAIGSAGAATEKDGTPWIGVFTQKIDPNLKEAFDLDRADGVVVVDIMKDSPAEKAGLHRKDIVISVNGKKVDSPDVLSEYVQETHPGDTTIIVVLHNGKEDKYPVIIGNRPGRKFDAARNNYGDNLRKYFQFGSTPSSYIGTQIIDLNAQLADYFGVPNGEGVLVTEVEKDSPAEKAGLKAGDVIVAVDGKAVAETQDLVDLIGDKEKGDKVTVAYYRRGARAELPVKVDERDESYGNMMMPNLNLGLPVMPGFRTWGHGSDDQGGALSDEYRKAIGQFRQERKSDKDEMEKLQQELKQLRQEMDDVKTKVH
ncbi:MAG: PDZ domain-containing protein [candidate division Zixibacteria bacterium]|nr:PDZ domain-containing protein [candidate division Zixibacteria bacterium]